MSERPIFRLNEHSPVLLKSIAGIVSTETKRRLDERATILVRYSIAVRVLEWVKATIVEDSPAGDHLRTSLGLPRLEDEQ